MAGIDGLDVTDLYEAPPPPEQGFRTGGPPSVQEALANEARGAYKPPPVDPGTGAYTRPVASGAPLTEASAVPKPFAAGQALRNVINNPAVRGAGALAGTAEAIGAGTDAVTDAQQGNYAGATDNGLRAGAATAAAMGATGAVAPAIGLGGAAYLGGHAIGTQIYNHMSPETQDAIGGSVNSLVRRAGNLFGQDWGVADPNETPAAATSTPIAKPATPPVVASAYPENADRHSIAPAAAPAQLGGVARTGNSFSDGSPPGSKSGYGVSTISGDPGAVQRAAQSDLELNGLRMQTANTDDRPPGIGSVGSGGAFGFGTPQERSDQVGAAERQYDLHQGLNSMHKGVRDASIAGIAQGDPIANANRTNASQERIAGLRERGETTRAIAANQTNRAIHSDDNAVSLRGQDTVLAGHRMANDVARAQMQREQGNFEATYAAGRTDAANTQAQIQHQNAADAIPRVTKEFEGMIPPGADGKPDTANAARYATAMHTAIADRIGELQNHVARNPSDRESKQKLNLLQSQGLDAMNPMAKAKFVAGMQLADVADATATGGLTPWGTRAIKSNAPITSIRKNASGDYVTNRRGVNGETEVIPARYIEKEGSTLGFGGQASNKFKALIE